MRFCQSLMYADPSQWRDLAPVAEAAGFDQISLSDHVFYPDKLDSAYPYTPSGRPMFAPDTQWPDVWVTTGALAAVTERIRFSTHVYVLPVRNPFVVAKAVGTAAWLSDDRVLLGVGAGWMREEFTQLEQPFERRGARMEEQIEVLRTLWRGGMVEHHGEFYDFDRLEMAPVPRRPVPVLIGGHSDIALRRAARIGDGWMGVYYDTEGLKDIVRRLQGFRQRVRHRRPAVRDPGLDRRPAAHPRRVRRAGRRGCDLHHHVGLDDAGTAVRLARGQRAGARDVRRAVHRPAAPGVSRAGAAGCRPLIP